MQGGREQGRREEKKRKGREKGEKWEEEEEKEEQENMRKNESNSLTCEWEGGNYGCLTRIYHYQTLSEFHKEL